MSSYGHYGPLDSHGCDQSKKKEDLTTIEDPTQDQYYLLNCQNGKVISGFDSGFDSIQSCEEWMAEHGTSPCVIVKYIHTITPVFSTAKEIVRS